MNHRNMTLRLAALIVLALCMWSPADADGLCDGDRRLILGGWSHHFDATKFYNEEHNGLGLQCGPWSVMTFENSEPPTHSDGRQYRDGGSEAYAVGYEWIPVVSRHGPATLSGGLSAALATGYDDVDVLPVGALRGRAQLGPVAAVVDYVPHEVVILRAEVSF